MKTLIPQKDLPTADKLALPLEIFADTFITLMVFFFVGTDFLIWLYQTIYFGLNKIPKIKRSKYVVINRFKLKGLTIWQKWNCGYCEYANGIILWLKAVANQTEIYSCAIKYSNQLPGQEYQARFYTQDEFSKKI